MLNPVRRFLAFPNPRENFVRLANGADRANAAKNWSEAEAGYAAALRIDPSQAPIWVQYGHALKEQARLAEAERAYRQALSAYPGHAETCLQLAHLLAGQGRGEEAAIFEAAASLQAPEARAAPLRDIDDLSHPAARDPDATVSRSSVRQRLQAAALPVSRTLSSRRPAAATAFIHLQKTGGTTLYDMLQHAFPPDRVCPVHGNFLHVFSAREMAEFDYFSGHFDYAALRLIPKRPLRTVSVFRRPRDRLVSIYRSHKAHQLDRKYRVNPFVRLANALTPEEFFEHPDVRNAPEVFNHYLAAFGTGYRQMAQARGLSPARIPAGTVERAIERVRGLDAIGITERFDDTVALIYETLGVPAPRRVKPRNVTDVVSAKMKGSPSAPVAMTPRLRDAMDELVCFDEPIYAAAVEEAERRLAAYSAASRTAASRASAAGS